MSALLITECFVNYNFQQTIFSIISTVEAIGQSLSILSFFDRFEQYMKQVSICKKEWNFLFVSVKLFYWQPIFLSIIRVGADAWSLMYPSIPDKLRSLYEDGYKLVCIFFVVYISYWIFIQKSCDFGHCDILVCLVVWLVLIVSLKTLALFHG